MYAAPEALVALLESRELQVAASLDAWSLGVMAYELLTGGVWWCEAEGLKKVQSFMLMQFYRAHACLLLYVSSSDGAQV